MISKDLKSAWHSSLRSQRVRKRTRQCRGPLRGPTPTSTKDAANMRIGRTVNHGLRGWRLLLRQPGSGPRSGPRLCRSTLKSAWHFLPNTPPPPDPAAYSLPPVSRITDSQVAGTNYSTAELHRMHKLRCLARMAAFDLKRSQKCLALFASWSAGLAFATAATRQRTMEWSKVPGTFCLPQFPQTPLPTHCLQYPESRPRRWLAPITLAPITRCSSHSLRRGNCRLAAGPMVAASQVAGTNYSTAKMHRMHKLKYLDRMAAFDLKRSQKCLALFASLRSH